MARATPPTPYPESPPADPTSNWKTYINSDFGLTLRYPNNWTAKENWGTSGLKEFHYLVLLTDPSNVDEVVGGNIGIMAWDNPSSLTLKEFRDAYSSGAGPGIYNDSAQQIIVAGHTAYLSHNQNCEPVKCSIYTIPVGTKIYEVYIFSPDKIKADRPTIDQIFSTFKFLDTTTDKSAKKFGYIRAITSNGTFYTLSIDLAHYISDNTRPSGYRIDNPDTKLTSYPLAQNLSIITQTFRHTTDGNFQFNQSVPFNEFLSRYQSDSSLKNIPYWFDMDGGTITKITE